jgi:uncharacterized protein (TIGR02594 family)
LLRSLSSLTTWGFKVVLKIGSSGQGVSDLQWMLCKAGFLTQIDGLFGPQTERNLKAFQATAGLAVDGEYGPISAAALASAIKPTTPPGDVSSETPWMDWMLKFVGQHEVAGPEANPFIVDLFSYTSLANTPYAFSDETPWCAACVCAALEKNGYASPHSAGVSAFDNYGERLQKPRYGAILNLGYHVTFFFDFKVLGYYDCLGGNQADSIKITKFPMGDVKSIHWPVKKEKTR